MTVRDPNVLVRIWHWLAGRPRSESAREAELRIAVAERDVLIDSLKHELDLKNATIKVHELEIQKLIDVCERDVQRVRTEAAAATFHRARVFRGQSEE